MRQPRRYWWCEPCQASSYVHVGRCWLCGAGDLPSVWSPFGPEYHPKGLDDEQLHGAVHR